MKKDALTFRFWLHVKDVRHCLKPLGVCDKIRATDAAFLGDRAEVKLFVIMIDS